MLVACNFTPVVRQNYRIGVPEGGWYDEILNTDSNYYGGSNVGNYPGLTAEQSESHGRPYSLVMTLPHCRWWCSNRNGKSLLDRVLAGHEARLILPRCAVGKTLGVFLGPDPSAR